MVLFDMATDNKKISKMIDLGTGSIKMHKVFFAPKLTRLLTFDEAQSYYLDRIDFNKVLKRHEKVRQDAGPWFQDEKKFDAK